MATRQKASAGAKDEKEKSLYEVQAVGVPRRCRAGHCFGTAPREVALTSAEAKAISDDAHLSIVAVGGEK